MDFRHVHAFIAVAEDLSLRKAARRLGVSQPALSRQVQQLEQELGLTLFARHRDGIELTHQGTVMLDQARRLATAATQFTETIRSAGSHRLGAVRLGIAWGLWDTVHRIRTHYAENAPDVAVLGQDIPSAQQPDALRQRRIDVGLLRLPVDSHELRYEILHEERVVAVLPSGHPLARRARIRLADLAGERLLLHDRELSPAIYDKILELYAAAGITPKIVPTSASPASPGGMIQVASGKGIYVGLGSLLALAKATGLAIVRLDDPGASLPVCVAWRAAESSAVVLSFIESARKACVVERAAKQRRRTARRHRRAGSAPRRPQRRSGRTGGRAA